MTIHTAPVALAARRTRAVLFALALPCAGFLLAPAVARADGGGAPSMPPPAQPSSTFDQQQPPSPEEKAAQDKERAQELYAQAYREVDKAKAELAEADDLRAKATANGASNADLAKKADEKADSAKKRLEKSRDKFQDVVQLDPENADGWNMLGFTRRKTGDVQGAFDAYWKCLSLKPEHFGAHEYMGEAYLEEGKLTEAKAELAWLQKHGADAATEASHLQAAIDRWTAANPDKAAAAASGATTNASAQGAAGEAGGK